MAYTLQQLAELTGGRLVGEADCRIRGVGSLQNAAADEISFLSDHHYVHHLPTTRAAAVILAERHLKDCPTQSLVVENPYLAYAQVAGLLCSGPALEHHSVAPGACIGADCTLEEPLMIAHGVCIGDRVHIGAGCRIDASCVIGDDVVIGRGCSLAAGVHLRSRVRLGARVIVHPGAVIGSDGFGIAWSGQDWLKIPQLGTVQIGDDVEIGANTTIDRGALNDTIIHNGVKIDNQVQIAHNVQVGEHTAIAGCSGIAGSTRIGCRCRIGGAVAISGHLQITDDVVIMGMSGVASSIDKPGVYASGLPVMDVAAWRRSVTLLPRLDSMAKSLRKLTGEKLK